MVSIMPAMRSLFLKRTGTSMVNVRLIPIDRIVSKLNKPMSFRLPYRYNSQIATNGQGDGGTIKGRTLEQDNPVSRRVMCYHRRTGALISKTWSDKNGYFEFNNLAPGIELYITSIDNDGNVVNHAAVTQDLLVAVAMT